MRSDNNFVISNGRNYVGGDGAVGTTRTPTPAGGDDEECDKNPVRELEECEVAPAVLQRSSSDSDISHISSPSSMARDNSPMQEVALPPPSPPSWPAEHGTRSGQGLVLTSRKSGK